MSNSNGSTGTNGSRNGNHYATQEKTNHNHAMPADRRYAHLAGWGKYVPEKILTNEELAKRVDTSDEWIQQMTGIRERHIADPKETSASMGIRAAKEALWVAGMNPSEV